MKLVRKNEIEKPQETYNLHVETDHNYIANDAVVSNCHGAKADVLKKMLTGAFSNVPIRLGFTGTIPKDAAERTSLHISVGPVVNVVTAKQLQEKGVLSWCEVDILQLKDDQSFGNYAAELKFLTTNEKRLQFIATMADKLDGNVLILVDRIAAGDILLDMIGEANGVFVSGATKSRGDIYATVKHNTQARIIATFGVAAVGIDVPEIDHLILLEPGKSFIRVIQSIGRALRRGQDSDYAHIWDITSNCKYAKKHLTERKKFYKSAEYPFKITKVDY